MIADILKDTFSTAISDIWEIGAPYLTIFAALLFFSFVKSIMDDREKRRKTERKQDAQTRLIEARARLAEIQLEKAEAQQKAKEDAQVQAEVEELESEEQELESEYESANNEYYQELNYDSYGDWNDDKNLRW